MLPPPFPVNQDLHSKHILEKPDLPKRAFPKTPFPQKGKESFSSKEKNIFDLSKEEHTNTENVITSTLSPSIPLERNNYLVGIIRLYSSPMEFSELAENMTHFIETTCQNGISTTTISIETSDPYSPFNGSTIAIDQYDTAPSALTIKLSGTPEATENFRLNLSNLQFALSQRLPTFQIALSPPFLKVHEKKHTHTHKSRADKKVKNILTPYAISKPSLL